MDARIAAYLAAADRFSDTVEAVDAADAWAAPSPCEGWAAADVLIHVVDTQRNFLAGRGVDLGPRAVGGPAEVWRGHLAATRAVLADEARATTTYEGYFGPTTLADTLQDFYGFDLRVHRWDLGRAAGVDVTWREEDLDAVEAAVDGFGEAMYTEGICGPALPVAGDASRQARLLARTGRAA